MNKEILLDCYFNELQSDKDHTRLFTQFPEIFSNCKTQPESFKVIDSDNTCEVSQVSVSDTSSFCSCSSMLTIEDSVLDDVFENRTEHFPFSEIEYMQGQGLKWYIKDLKVGISGPFESHRMDDLFQKRLMRQNVEVKSSKDDHFYTLEVVIKKYCRVFKEMNLGMKNITRTTSQNKSMTANCKSLMDIENLMSKLKGGDESKAVLRISNGESRKGQKKTC